MTQQQVFEKPTTHQELLLSIKESELINNRPGRVFWSSNDIAIDAFVAPNGTDVVLLCGNEPLFTIGPDDKVPNLKTPVLDWN